MRSNTCLAGLRSATRIDFFLTLTLCLLLATAQAQTFTVLHAFKGMPDGKGPNGVILDSSGIPNAPPYRPGFHKKEITSKTTPGEKKIFLNTSPAPNGPYPD